MGNSSGCCTTSAKSQQVETQGDGYVDGPQPASPRSPRPPKVDSRDLAVGADEEHSILTQVAKGPPSPGIASPRSANLNKSMAEGLLVPLLPPPSTKDEGKPCLVLDLDETLVHAEREKPSSWDFEIFVEVGNNVYHIWVRKRPGLDEFLKSAAEHFELIAFTASMEEYGRAVVEKIDPEGLIKHVLARKQCTLVETGYPTYETKYVKDLTQLGRKLRDVILLDDNPNAYWYQPENALPINQWYDDPTDTELAQVLTILDLIVKSDRSAVTILAELDERHGWDRKAELAYSPEKVRLS